MSWKQWDQGEIVEAGDFQEFIQDQVVQSYANDSERNTTLGTAVKEGMLSYREDANVVEVYDGSQWLRVGEEGDITAVTAGIALTGGGTSGNVTLDVDVAGLAGTALTVSGETLNVDETELFTGGTEGFTALSNGTAGLSYQPISHNYIINGAFDIWQRGTAQKFLQSGEYAADRWTPNLFQQNVVERVTLTAAAEPPTAYALRSSSSSVAQSGGGTRMRIGQKVESVNTYLLRGKQVTLSFWVRFSNSSFTASAGDFGDFRFVLGYNTTTTDGSTVSTFPDSQNEAFITSGSFPTTFTRYSLTATVPSNANNVLAYFSMSTLGNTTNIGDEWYEITGVQIEAGSIATPFKRNANSIAGEKLACQRYYLAFDGNNNSARGFGWTQSTTELRAIIPTPVTMRVTPTISLDDGGIYAGGNFSSLGTISAQALVGNGVQFNAVVSGVSNFQAATLKADNTSYLDAEL